MIIVHLPKKKLLDFHVSLREMDHLHRDENKISIRIRE